MSTKRERIILELHDRLSGNTSAGSRVYRGRTKFDDQDTFPVISIISTDSDIVDQHGERTIIDWPINVQAIVAADLNNPSDTMEPLLGEIKTYLFETYQETLNGHCIEVTYLGDGGDENDEDIYVSASVRINVRYVEHVGEPTK